MCLRDSRDRPSSARCAGRRLKLCRRRRHDREGERGAHHAGLSREGRAWEASRPRHKRATECQTHNHSARAEAEEKGHINPGRHFPCYKIRPYLCNLLSVTVRILMRSCNDQNVQQEKRCSPAYARHSPGRPADLFRLHLLGHRLAGLLLRCNCPSAPRWQEHYRPGD